MRSDDPPRGPTALPQGDLRLLETDQARRLLAAPYLAHIDQPGTRMARIAVRPTWVGLLDFQTRVPAGFAQ
jgi:hypothetical protein